MKNFLRSLYASLIDAARRVVYFALRNLPARYYQPVYGRRALGVAPTDSVARACNDRWEAIAPHLGEGESVLDIGCNLGFFTLSAAERDCLAVGVDFDPFYVTACRAIASSTGATGAIFIRAEADRDFVSRLPVFDSVFNFSVFHHWVRHYGEDRAKDIMRQLAPKCRRMFFETGQSDELGASWHDRLRFMGDDPEKWITEFLREIGFRRVTNLGQFATGLTPVERHLFLAEK